MLGMISWLTYEKHQVKRKIKRQIIAGISKSELIKLHFSKTEIKTKLRWKHSKEFEYDEQMYDVVIKEQNNDSITYWCWWDFEETRLNKQLDALVAFSMDKLPQKKQQQNFIDQVLDHLYLPKQGYIFTSGFTPKETICSIYSQTCQTNYNRPPEVPPEYTV